MSLMILWLAPEDRKSFRPCLLKKIVEFVFKNITYDDIIDDEPPTVCLVATCGVFKFFYPRILFDVKTSSLSVKGVIGLMCIFQFHFNFYSA